MKIVIICSTNASVVKKAISTNLLDDHTIEFVSDRQCGALDFAKSNGYTCNILQAATGSEFSCLLNEKYKGCTDTLFVSFYTRLLTTPFLEQHQGRLINFHPSILPSCPGMNGFGGTIKSGAKFIGSTVHLIDSGADTGQPLLQGSFPRSPLENINSLRHRVFLQQAISLIQIILWFNVGKIVSNGNDYIIDKANYKISEFSPNLDACLQVLYTSWLDEIF